MSDDTPEKTNPHAPHGPPRAGATRRLLVLGGVVAAVVALVVGLLQLGGSDDATTAADAGGSGASDAGGGSGAVVEDNAAEKLVDADWLEANLDDPSVVLIEVSTDEGLYERGHIPGAVNFPWTTSFVDTVSRDVVSRETFGELTAAAGVDEDSTVVLYGDDNNWFAAWGAWVFNLYGHDNVKLLDGGRTKWDADGRAYDVAVPAAAAGSWQPAEADGELRALFPEVLEVAQASADGDDPGAVLVDIRGAAEFNGEIFAPEGFQETAIRAGHIPGAVNVAWRETVNEDGTFKSADELRAIYAAHGIDGSEPVITYCRIGERASHSWFVLSEILGYDVSLYDGSWTEYGNAVGVPVVNNAGTVWGVA
ncbi:sulfurtransferase [Nocardioides zeae]|uniref:Sulfurtransferase n=1 Tax=Nocardioides zeae TaxID=1457234 RepID=A0AAJ1X1S8_9ACTN|nr:sulfurtransferase [Nocardioides zeae]MDQ1105893.1 thiosulfate/3-mercaptopyruvate sulfurtransferase [Nocardioides zeae]